MRLKGQKKTFNVLAYPINVSSSIVDYFWNHEYLLSNLYLMPCLKELIVISVTSRRVTWSFARVHWSWCRREYLTTTIRTTSSSGSTEESTVSRLKREKYFTLLLTRGTRFENNIIKQLFAQTWQNFRTILMQHWSHDCASSKWWLMVVVKRAKLT